jgi:hypothetical protein
MGPTPLGLDVAADPGAWRALGFAVDADDIVRIGAVAVRLGVPGRGITGWTLSGAQGPAEIDGIPTAWARPLPAAGAAHPNGAHQVDHVVVRSPDVARTLQALTDAGMTLRRERSAGEVRFAFFRHGECIVELAGPVQPEAAGGPARLWGLTLQVADLDAAARLLGDALGEVRDAVQPGRRIATVRREAGAGIPLALMDWDAALSGP